MRGGVEASLGARGGKHLTQRHVGRHLDLLAHAVPNVHREARHLQTLPRLRAEAGRTSK
jgi:hypothetical protein